MKSITIRLCQKEDLPAVLALQRQWVKEDVTYGLVEAKPEELRTCLGPYFLVADRNGSIVGFIIGSEGRSDGVAVIPKGERYVEIGDLYVVPALRGQGVGRKLIEKLEETVRSDGIERLLIYSASKDVDRILKFYRSCGFRSWFVQMYK